VTNVDKLYAVIGGFHLATSKAGYIEQTIDKLQALAADLVAPTHCTGAAFIGAMQRRTRNRGFIFLGSLTSDVPGL